MRRAFLLLALTVCATVSAGPPALGQIAKSDPASRRLLAQSTVAASFNPADDHWDSRFEYPGANDMVCALAIDGGRNLYAAGVFTALGAEAGHVARWNGTTWSPLGTGTDDWVSAIAVDGSGNLYAGGQFTSAGGVPANRVARWDGTAWSQLWTGVGTPQGPESIGALAVGGDGRLYVGGSFAVAGGVSANGIACWNGSGWTALGSGITGTVSALAFDRNGNLYVGGTFSTAGGVSASNIARWDGTSWSALGAGVNSTVRALAVDAGGNVYAGGYFSAAGGVSASSVARWDGTSWSALGIGMNGFVYTLALDAGGKLYAGGGFSTAGGTSANRIARWNGTSWAALGPGTNNTILDLVLDAGGNLYAGGDFTIAGGVSMNRVARWDGAAWSAVGIGLGLDAGTNVVAADAEGNAYAGGQFMSAGGLAASRVAHWDGASWSALGTGMNGALHALVVDRAGNVYAGGFFSTAGGVSASNIARWDGTSWSPLGSGMNDDVGALAVDGEGNLYAGGAFTTAGGVSASRIAKWDGTNWSPLGSGTSGATYPHVIALAVDRDGNVYAGGTFPVIGGVSASYIAKWDGTSWSALGAGVNNTVRALAVDFTGNLYAGGYFTTAGEVSAVRVAKWDGSSWSALGAGLTGGYYNQVYALAVDPGGTVYAGGEFTIADGLAANRVARWNGTGWSALGSGIEGTDYTSVWSLALDGQRNLYASGLFPTAGGKGSSNFAIWHGDANVGVPGFAAAPEGFALHAGAPNPFVRSTALSFDLPRATHVRLDVLDVCGRRVRTLLSESQPAGRHFVRWDGTDDRGRRSAAGVYHCRMQAGSFVATRQLVLVP